jgi:hypothetical protein
MLTKNLTARMYRHHLLKSESAPEHVFEDIADRDLEAGVTGVPRGAIGPGQTQKRKGRVNRKMLFHRVEFSSMRSEP